MGTAAVSSAQVEMALQAAELSQQAVAKALLAGQPDLLEAAATELQRASTALSDAVLQANGAIHLHAPLRLRVVAVARSLAMHREACLRRAAVVARSLQSILPGAPGTLTYGSSAGPYGSTTRQSGAFNVLSA